LKLRIGEKWGKGQKTAEGKELILVECEWGITGRDNMYSDKYLLSCSKEEWGKEKGEKN